MMQDYASLQAEYHALQRLSNKPGFPRALYFGQQEVPDGLSDFDAATKPAKVDKTSSLSPSSSTPRAVLVMDVLGPSLERLLNETTLGTGDPRHRSSLLAESKCSSRQNVADEGLNLLWGAGGLSPGTVIALSTQMIDRLESLSSCGIVHGDIQLGNFLMGKDGPHHRRTVHLIDFGLSASTRPSKGPSSPPCLDPASTSSTGRYDSNCSDPPAGGRGVLSGRVSGTLDFSSSHVLQGLPPRPQDDLESLAYCLAY